MIVYKGNILSVNSNDDVFKYLVEDKGIIRFVGNSLPSVYENKKIIDLGTKALIPAFVDTHQHFASFSTFNAGLNVMDASSNVEMMEMIKAFVEKNRKKKTLIAFGASPYSVVEERLISRIELDSVCPNQEIMVVKYDGHACIINSKLLDNLRNKLKNLRGFHEDSGEMNQEAFFECSNYITNSLSLIDLIKNMQKAVDFEASYGIGEIHSVSGVGFKGDLDITLEKIFAKSLSNGEQLRIFPQSMDIQVAIKRKLPRIGGCFKCALDGCFGSADASMNEPYTDGSSGVLYYTDEEVIEFCKKANRAGLQIEMHAIGDKAFDQACKAIKAALDDCPRENHRHGIIHNCLPTKNGLEICKQYNILMLVQSAFIDWKQEPNDYLESILGQDRVKRLNPLKDFAYNGIIASFGSDAPCTSPNPIVWMDKAVNNENVEQRITPKQALRMCTYNGYYSCYDEKQRGSLEEGKIADMVILSANPYTSNISAISVEKLYLKGKPYKSAKKNILSTIVSGLFSRRKA